MPRAAGLWAYRTDGDASLGRSLRDILFRAHNDQNRIVILSQPAGSSIRSDISPCGMSMNLAARSRMVAAKNISNGHICSIVPPTVNDVRSGRVSMAAPEILKAWMTHGGADFRHRPDDAEIFRLPR